MTCAGCNAEVSAGNNFCRKCGRPVAHEDAPTEGSARKARWPLLFYLGVPLVLLAGEGMLVSRHGMPREAPANEASLILKDLVDEQPESPPPKQSVGPPEVTQPNCPIPAPCPPPARGPATWDDSAMLRAQEELRREKAQHAADLKAAADREEQLRAQLAAAKPAAPDAADELGKLRRANQDLTAELANSRKTEEVLRRKIEQLTPGPPPPYASSGTIVWQGEVHGKELFVIDDGVADKGVATGKLPGVACFVQSSDPKRVVITDPPRPSNHFQRLVFQVTANGKVTVRFTWVVQK